MTFKHDSDWPESALSDYLAKTLAGASPSRAAFLAEHPDLEHRLTSQLATLRVLDEMVSCPGEAGEAARWPEEIGQYRLLKPIGRGGMATVFLAQSIREQRLVALKLIDAATASPSLGKRFEHESVIALRLRHPNLVTVYERGADQQYSYYAMEFVPGATLATLIERARTLGDRGEVIDLQKLVSDEVAVTARQCGLDIDDLEPEDAPRKENYVASVARIVAELADGLAYLHEQRMLHRDVKPSNILLDRTLTPRLADYGLAREMARSVADASVTQGMLGTLDYMSPEMVSEGAAGVDQRTDIYSLGVTLYELLTLRTPQTRKSTLRSFMEVTRSDPPSPRLVAPTIPRDLETITLKALEKSPRRRYQTAHDFAEDLRRFLRYERIRARPVSLVRRVARVVGRNPKTFIAIAIATAALGIEQVVVLRTQDAEYAKLVRSARSLLSEEKFGEARALVLGAAALRPTSDELVPLRRIADGTFPVPFRSTPSGALVQVSRLDDFGTATFDQTLGPTVDSGSAEGWLRVGNYRVLIEKAGFGYGEYLLEVSWKNNQPGLNVQLRATGESITGMALIPEGTYKIGFTPTEKQRTTPLDLEESQIALEAFYIDVTEVSNAAYAEFVRATNARAPWKEGAIPEGEELFPVVGLSWVEATAYAEWLGKRLPTQREWEAAARGKEGFVYPWGNEFVPSNVLGSDATSGDSPRRPVRVDSPTKDVSPFEVRHMARNVREWVFDPWVARTDVLPHETWQMPVGYRVVKGDSIMQILSPSMCRGSARGYLEPNAPPHKTSDVGFRCAKTKRP